jgi:hypothetical protein
MVLGDALVTACTQVHYLKAVSVLRKPGFFSRRSPPASLFFVEIKTLAAGNFCRPTFQPLNGVALRFCETTRKAE